MKLIFFVFILAAVQPSGAYAQLYTTRSGFIGFYSKTALEDIRGENNQVYAVIDAGRKNLAFAALLRGFIFPKELMQEHFNENYVESDKYPKAIFSGAYTGDVALDKDGVYQVAVKGNLTLHNVTRTIETEATLEVRSGHLLGVAEFKVKPEDFNIGIPAVVRDKIDKEVTVKVNIDCTTK
ncbi:MAG TPA: YceI family protein [Puia sp.]|nr:YceI family protein [Puia sp.]